MRMPAIARKSWPAVLGANELTVEVTDDTARKMLDKMKGNIEGALKRLGYKADGDFEVKIVGAKKPEHKTPKKKAVRRKIPVDDARVKKYMDSASDILPEDISQALSHLMAYLELQKLTR